MDETHAPDELMRRARRFRRLATATLLLTACSVAGFIGAVYADAVPLWKAATGSACSLSFAAYIAADARREYWLRRWLGSLSRR
jgi:outer membrane biogenesis lipoprotein LolB